MYHTLRRKGNIHNFKRNCQNFCCAMAWRAVPCTVCVCYFNADWMRQQQASTKVEHFLHVIV